MKNFKTIAITGGIGSGKSAVADIIRSLGYPVYDADKIYADLLKDDDFVCGIYESIGLSPEYLGEKITFDRKTVAEAVFFDKRKLFALNAFTHEKVYGQIKKIIDAHQGDAPLFFEIQLLFESGREIDFDNVLVVKRPISERVNALKERNGLDEKNIFNRIQNQIDYDKTDFSEHTLIINDSDLTELREKVKSALGEILRK